MSLPAHKPSKPPPPPNLTQALSEARAISGGTSSRPPTSAVRVVQKSVLVVDPDPAVRAVLVSALSPHYIVYEATDGLAAAELASQIPTPSLLVCDVVLPRLDGFQLAQIFKSHPLLKGVPIMFLSSRTGATDMMRGISLGAKQYVTKPFKVSDVVARITKIVGA